MRAVLPLLLLLVPALSSSAGFRVEERAGKFRLIDPQGRPFYSMGVGVIVPGDWSPVAGSAVYRGAELRGGPDAWAKFEADRLRLWGFNTVAGWSDRRMERQGIPYVAVLHLAQGTPHRLIDVWDPAYALKLDEACVKQMGDRSMTDPDRIGWCVDNELPWFGEAGWRTSDPRTLLDRYRELSRTAPGRARADALTDAAGPGLQVGRNAEYQQAQAADRFAGEVATRFMELAVAAVRKRDPQGLILGVRFAGDAPIPVIRAVGAASDVLTVNAYVKSGRPDPVKFDWWYLHAKKPVMITEFSYRAMENRSGLMNSKGADVTVKTQADRARRYRRYVETLAALPQIIGFHWFQWADQPTKGRFDGEDSNYGIVDQQDEPYEPLLATMRDLNAKVQDLHTASPLQLPTAFGEPRPSAKLQLVGVDVRKERAPRPFRPRIYAEWPKAKVTADLWGDPASRCDGTFTVKGKDGIFAFTSAPGWGCGVSLVRTGATLFDAAGATTVVMKLTGSKGLRFRVILAEDGLGSPDAASHTGADGADGEQYEGPWLTAAGTDETIRMPLGDCTQAEGWGNQSGQGVLDTQSLRHLGLQAEGGQGAGSLSLRSIRFE